MMILIRVFFVITILSTVHGISVDNGEQTLLYKNGVRQDGYNVKYRTSYGVETSGQARMKPIEEDLEANGIFNFTIPYGKFISLTFQADENGYYRPVVEIFPVRPCFRIPSSDIVSIRLPDDMCLSVRFQAEKNMYKPVVELVVDDGYIGIIDASYTGRIPSAAIASLVGGGIG